MHKASGIETLERIQGALDAAVSALAPFIPRAVQADQKAAGRGPVTEADRAVNRVLREALLRDGEGWLSEESVDDLERLQRRRVWVVDPLDGTLEFVAGIPEWCVSVAMVEDGRPVAGGISNPATGEVFLGSLETGLDYNGKPARASQRSSLEGAVVLASRSEVKRGEWERFQQGRFVVRAVGSVAYKLARVAVGLADATWTLNPKNEWDIAAGAVLVEAAGGLVRSVENSTPTFNNKSTLLPGLIACGPGLSDELASLLRSYMKSHESR